MAKKENQPSGAWFVDLSDRFNKSDQGFKCSIVGIGEKPANQFTPSPLNYRDHPEIQRNSVLESLGMFGWVSGVIENKSGNLIDGHERVWDALKQGEDTLVPYLLIDIPESQESDLLLVYDRLGEMITVNKDNLSLLMQESNITEDTPNLSDLIKTIAMENSIIPPDFEPEDIDVSDPEDKTVKCPECGHEFKKD